MGIWSEFLAAFPDGNTLVLNDSKVPDDVKRQLSHCLSFNTTDPSGDDETCTVSALMSTCPDTAKIYDYLDDAEVAGWSGLFKCILEQNPTIPRAELHFYCSDHRSLYTMVMPRSTMRLRIYVEKSSDAAVDDEHDDVDEEYLVIHKATHVQRVSVGDFPVIMMNGAWSERRTYQGDAAAVPRLPTDQVIFVDALFNMPDNDLYMTIRELNNNPVIRTSLQRIIIAKMS